MAPASIRRAGRGQNAPGARKFPGGGEVGRGVFWNEGARLSAQRTLDLRRAAAIIFALIGVLPLLLFVFFLWHFDLIVRTEAQVGLLLALIVAVLGYTVFHRMVASISSLTRAFDLATAGDHNAARSATDSGVVAGLGSVIEIGEMANAFS